VTRTLAAVTVEVPTDWRFSPDWATRVVAAQHPGAVVDRVDVDPIDPGTTTRARIHLTYRDGEGPATLFLKAQGRLSHRLMLSSLALLTPESRLFASGEALPARRPMVYAVGIDRRRLNSIVVMEDVVATGAVANIATSPMSVDEVGRGLEEIASLHSRFWNNLPPALSWIRPWRIQHGWTLLALIGGIKGPPRLKDAGQFDVLPDSARRWDRCLWLSRRSAALSKQGPQTLLHGDTHIGNTYTMPDGAVGFLDWQLVRRGNWSHDVGYFITSALTETDRRAHERDLLAHYLDALGPQLTSDEAWRTYRCTPAYGLTAWLETYASADYQSDDVSLTLLRRFGTAFDDLGTAALLG
jgi:Phosphotransferase enzyme family